MDSFPEKGTLGLLCCATCEALVNCICPHCKGHDFIHQARVINPCQDGDSAGGGNNTWSIMQIFVPGQIIFEKNLFPCFAWAWFALRILQEMFLCTSASFPNFFSQLAFKMTSMLTTDCQFSCKVVQQVVCAKTTANPCDSMLKTKNLLFGANSLK